MGLRPLGCIVGLGSEQIPDREVEARRVEPQRARSEDPGPDLLAIAPMVDDQALVGVDLEVVLDARHAEIAAELDASVVVPRARRRDLDDDQGVRDLDHVAVEGVPATDQHVGPERGRAVDPDRDAVDISPARHAGRDDRRPQDRVGFAFCLDMAQPLGRNGVDAAIDEFVIVCLGLGPVQELVDRHLGLELVSMASVLRHQFLDREVEAGWVQAEAAMADDPRPNLVAVAPVVHDHAPVRIDQKIVLNAWHGEIAGELQADIDMPRVWRSDFDDNDGIRRFDRIAG